jgi:hypothetical protein
MSPLIMEFTDECRDICAPPTIANYRQLSPTIANYRLGKLATGRSLIRQKECDQPGSFPIIRLEVAAV